MEKEFVMEKDYTNSVTLQGLVGKNVDIIGNRIGHREARFILAVTEFREIAVRNYDVRTTWVYVVVNESESNDLSLIKPNCRLRVDGRINYTYSVEDTCWKFCVRSYRLTDPKTING